MNRRQSMAMEPEELGMTWFKHVHTPPPAAGKQPVPPETKDLEELIREVKDEIDTKVDQYQDSLKLMIRMMDERLNSFEARLPPSPVQPAKTGTKAKRHDTPLFSHPP